MGDSVLNRWNFEIARLAPNDEGSAHLAGIRVGPGGTAVTDGRCAILVTAAEQLQGQLFGPGEGITAVEEFSPFMLDRESALKIAAALPRKTKDDEQPVLPVVDQSTETTDRAMISVNDAFRQEVLRAPKMGSFPAIESMLPEREKAKFSLLFNPDLLLDVLKAVRTFCAGRETYSIELSFFGSGKPMRIDADGHGQFLTAIVMPQSSGSEGLKP